MRVPADPITGGASDEAPSVRFRAYAADLRHGDELIAARLNTLLSSQSFLAIAYASSMASANGRWREPFALAVPPVLALLGFLLTFAGHLDIRAAKAEVANWRRLAEELLARSPELREQVDSPRSAGEVVAGRAPLVLMAGWTWFFFVPWWLRAL